jgi:hypothetical protein
MRLQPDAARTSRQLSQQAKGFRNALRSQKDPVALLLQDLPKTAGRTASQLANQDDEVLPALKTEIDQVVEIYRENASRAIRSALQGSLTDCRSTREIAKSWAECFQPLLSPKNPQRPLLIRMQTDYDSDGALADSLSGALSRVSIPRWEPHDAAEFEAAINEAVRGVEERVLNRDLSALRGDRSAKPLMALLASRVRDYAKKLHALAGDSGLEELDQDIKIALESRKPVKRQQT